jgi:hypothetical protein
MKDLLPGPEGAFVALLLEYKDVLTWSPFDLQEVSQDLIEHHLRVDPKKKPHKQKVQKMSTERKEATQEEVQKLLEAKVIWGAMHTEWLASLVLVKKGNEK